MGSFIPDLLHLGVCLLVSTESMQLLGSLHSMGRAHRCLICYSQGLGAVQALPRLCNAASSALSTPKYCSAAALRHAWGAACRAPERVAGLALVAPALPTNDPKNSWSTGGGLGRKLRFAAVRAILQVHVRCHVSCLSSCNTPLICSLSRQLRRA